MSLRLLTTYLAEMGRCGAHLSLHDKIEDHDYLCRRAHVALSLMDPYVVKSIDSEVAWDFAVGVIETLNGSIYRGLNYLEVPEEVFEMLNSGFNSDLELANMRIKNSGAQLKQLNALQKCLRIRYQNGANVNLGLESLTIAGLEQDPIDLLDDY